MCQKQKLPEEFGQLVLGAHLHQFFRKVTKTNALRDLLRVFTSTLRPTASLYMSAFWGETRQSKEKPVGNGGLAKTDT